MTRTPILLIALVLCACSGPTFSSADQAQAGSAGTGSYASTAGSGSYGGSGGTAGTGGVAASGGAPQTDAGTGGTAGTQSGTGGSGAAGGTSGTGGNAGSTGGSSGAGDSGGPTVTCGDGSSCTAACYYSLGKYSCTRPLAQGVVELDCDATSCGAGSVCCIHFAEQLSTQSWYPTSADCQLAGQCAPAPEHLPMCNPAQPNACPTGWTCRKPFNSYAPTGYNMCWQ